MLIGKYHIRLNSQKGSIGGCNSRSPVKSHVADEALAQWTSEASGEVNRITRVTALQNILGLIWLLWPRDASRRPYKLYFADVLLFLPDS